VSETNVSRFGDGLFYLLEDAKHLKKSPFEAKRIVESYLSIYAGVDNYKELDATTRTVLNIYYPEIKIAEQTEPAQNQTYRRPKSSS